MAIDSLAIWDSTFLALPKVGGSIWTDNISNWVDARVTGKMDLPGLGHASPPPFSFTFDKGKFKSELLLLTITGNQAAAMAAFAAAWEQAILTSTALTKVGSFIGSDTPATKWSVVSSTVIDPPSIVLGKAKVILLAAEPPAADGDSKFPLRFREAFLELTVTTTGLDSVPPAGGPNPLVDPARAVA